MLSFVQDKIHARTGWEMRYINLVLIYWCTQVVLATTLAVIRPGAFKTTIPLAIAIAGATGILIAFVNALEDRMHWDARRKSKQSADQLELLESPRPGISERFFKRVKPTVLWVESVGLFLGLVLALAGE